MNEFILDRYDTGLLGDGGGGDVEWWHKGNAYTAEELNIAAFVAYRDAGTI